jgi:DNA-binding transcriptional LysR family regulator
MLDAQRLQVLAEVARAGSIASAARRLAFTPSAVSADPVVGREDRRALHR